MIFAVKGVALSPAVLVFGGVLVVIATWRMVSQWRIRNGPSRTVAAWQIAACWMAWCWLSIDGHFAARTSLSPRFDPARPVACLGDSLTAYGYPDALAELIASPVVNRGHDGLTTSAALARLPKVLADNPQVVIVELGGHDFLKGYQRDEPRANLNSIITACRSHGAEVVLVEIPRGLVHDPYRGLERELAREFDLELVPDTPIRRLVLWSPYGPPGMWLSKSEQLSDDGLHPNAAGNQVLAKYVAAALKRMYGRAALRRRD
jgi:lysophospholipase L1-like esterase